MTKRRRITAQNGREQSAANGEPEDDSASEAAAGGADEDTHELFTPAPKAKGASLPEATRTRLKTVMYELQRSGVKRLSSARKHDPALTTKLVAIGGDEASWDACFLEVKKDRVARGVALFGSVQKLMSTEALGLVLTTLVQSSIFAQAQPDLMRELARVAADGTDAREVLEQLLLHISEAIDTCVRAAAAKPNSAAGALTLRMRTMVQRHVEALKPRWVELTAATFSAPQACACLKSISLSIEDAIAKRLRDSSPGAAETGREPSPDRAGADAESAALSTSLRRPPHAPPRDRRRRAPQARRRRRVARRCQIMPSCRNARRRQRDRAP